MTSKNLLVSQQEALIRRSNTSKLADVLTGTDKILLTNRTPRIASADSFTTSADLFVFG